MSLFPRLALVFLLVGIARADSETQTDWTGGPGATGPWGSWDDSFLEADGCMNWGCPEEIRLELLQIPHGVGEYASAVLSEDVDGDGDQDIVCAGGGIEWVESLDGSGMEWLSHPVAEPTSSAEVIDTADVDGDGDTDILYSAWFDDEISWMENDPPNPSFSWSKHIVNDSFEGAESVSSGDFDGDGDMDVVGAGEDYYTWWENIDGSGTGWIEHRVKHVNGAGCVHAADVDGDGDVDFLGASRSASRIDYYENDGTGTTWIQHYVALGFNLAWWVYADDVDGDGDMDVLGAAHDGSRITWWENLDGPGTSWTQHDVDADFEDACCVHAADLDDDGDVDVLGAGGSPEQIAWWENVDGSGVLWHKHVAQHRMEGAFPSVRATSTPTDPWISWGPGPGRTRPFGGRSRTASTRPGP